MIGPQKGLMQSKVKRSGGKTHLLTTILRHKGPSLRKREAEMRLREFLPTWTVQPGAKPFRLPDGRLEEGTDMDSPGRQPLRPYNCSYVENSNSEMHHVGSFESAKTRLLHFYLSVYLRCPQLQVAGEIRCSPPEERIYQLIQITARKGVLNQWPHGLPTTLLSYTLARIQMSRSFHHCRQSTTWKQGLLHYVGA